MFRVVALLITASVIFGFQNCSPMGFQSEFNAASNGLDPQTKACIPNSANHTPLQRLTTRQITNTLRDGFKIQAAIPDTYPRDDRTSGFTSLAHTQVISSQFVEQHLDWMITVAQQIVAARHPSLFLCPLTENTCVDSTLTVLMTKAFRRPPTTEEVQTYRQTLAQITGTLDERLSQTLAAILSSPQFLYREIQHQRPEDSASIQDLNAYELAQRLSYLLWDSSPDDALMAAAESGDLLSPQVQQAHIRRMISDPKIQGLATSMADQWLGLSKLWNHNLNGTLFPQFNAPLKKALHEEVVAQLQYVLQNKRPLSDLVAADYTFASQTTASLQGLVTASPIPIRLNSPPSRRAGLMSLPAILAITSRDDKTSIVARGLWVNEVLLCTHIPEPDPTLDISLPDNITPDMNPREILEYHRARPQCAACHNIIDPPGLALEFFDPLGRSRTLWPNSEPISSPVSTAQFASSLATRKQFVNCIAEKLVPLALGRLKSTDDSCQLGKVTNDSLPPATTLADLVERLALSSLFTTQAGATP